MMKKALLSITAMLITVSVFAQWVISGGNASISNAGNPTQVVIGSIATGKTYGALTTSQDANGYFSIHSVSASGSSYGNLVLNPSGGNVGVGTTTPSAPLHILKASIPTTNVAMQTWGPAINNYDLTLSNYNSAWGIDYRFTQFINGAAAPVLTFQGGNVGVGTTDPLGYKLAVNGAAIATSMKVKLQSNWPDFVFLKDYKLPTLTEVKTYIDKNRHLPDMPSADEVHKNGLDLGEMNRLLLKKVEELTLYLIDKEAQLFVHKQQLKDQQLVNESQQRQIELINKQQVELAKSLYHK